MNRTAQKSVEHVADVSGTVARLATGFVMRAVAFMFLLTLPTYIYAL